MSHRNLLDIGCFSHIDLCTMFISYAKRLPLSLKTNEPSSSGSTDFLLLKDFISDCLHFLTEKGNPLAPFHLRA